jgi:hypothetical protein
MNWRFLFVLSVWVKDWMIYAFLTVMISSPHSWTRPLLNSGKVQWIKIFPIGDIHGWFGHLRALINILDSDWQNDTLLSRHAGICWR